MNGSTCRGGSRGCIPPAALAPWLIVTGGFVLAACGTGRAEEDVWVTDQPKGLMQQMGDIHEAAAGDGPVWSATVDALMLWQGNIPSVPVFTNDAGSVVLDANDAEPAMTAGPRFGLQRQIGETHAIEGNYFNVRSFDGGSLTPAAGGPFVINPALGNLLQFGDIQAGTLATQSQIQSGELNWRTWNGGLINWIAGFRWVEWNQQSSIDYAFENPSTANAGTVNLGNTVGNNLYGGQLGADIWLWNDGGPWRVNAVGKAGVFYNRAAYSRSIASVSDSAGTLVLGAPGAKADETSFVGELGVNASYNVTEWLAIRAGYTLFWLSGVATTPDNLLAADIAQGTALVNTQGSVLLHGVTTGLEARW